MNIRVETLPEDIRKISLAGTLDIHAAQEIDLQLSTLMATERAFVVLDLENVTFMSSIGIGILVRCTKAARLRGGNVVFLNPQPVVRMVLEKTRIHTLIEICDNLAAACLAVKEPPPSLA